MPDATPLLRVRAVSKSFGAVAAVREVSFDLYGGEARALVGENGAGKSTIVKMLAGVHRPDTGSIELNGVPTDLGTPADAKAAGIAVIYQEPTLFPDLSVAENIAMGRQPLGRFKTIDRAAMVRQAAQLFTRLGVSIDSVAGPRIWTQQYWPSVGALCSTPAPTFTLSERSDVTLWAL